MKNVSELRIEPMTRPVRERGVPHADRKERQPDHVDPVEWPGLRCSNQVEQVAA